MAGAEKEGPHRDDTHKRSADLMPLRTRISTKKYNSIVLQSKVKQTVSQKKERKRRKQRT